MKAEPILAAAAALLLLPTSATAHKLITKGLRVPVAKSALTIDPGIDWNRMNARPGRNAEAWTLDGLALNEVTFYGGVAGDHALFKEVDKKNRPLPRFAANMLPTDVVQLFESSYRIAGGSALFAVDGIEPATFAEHRGFRFRYHFTLENEVRRDGEAAGAIVGGKLYLVTYEAPTIYYYGRNLVDYRALVASARLPGPSVTIER